jgi:molybdopterin molybdotransferase
MLDFQDARKKMLNAVESRKYFPVERLALAQAAGRVLNEEVVSPVAVPGNDYSAMDGYAVNTADFHGANEVSLPQRGICQTGHPVVALEPGGCVRIFTGAHIPPGADAVVMQENTERTGDKVKFSTPPRRGENIRRAGEDLQVGDAVLARGMRLFGYQLGLLASVERSEVLVAPRPQVTILCTGDELRPPGNAFASGNLAESNSVALAALIEQAGGRVTVGPVVKDDQAKMAEALHAAHSSSDVIITVGGVSVGDHDVVAPALEEVGAEILFHKVKIKPGKPVLFARWGEKFVLGLPGNPSSAQVTFALFGFPLIRALQGDALPVPEQRTARLAERFVQRPGRTGFYRARLRGDQVEILSNQASGASTSIAWANALVIVESDCESIEAGGQVSVMSLDSL